MGNRPCLVLVEWELLLIPQEWPMTEQTESCLFSGSVIRGEDTEKIKTGERPENMISTPRLNKQRKIKKVFFFLI